jgi:hypothetical protein
MEKENIIEMYEKDLAELDTVISTLTRPNIKRQLEDIKSSINRNLTQERKKMEKVETQPKTNEITYESISKYAFDSSGESFVK